MTAPTLTGSWYSRGNSIFPSVTTALNISKSWFWLFKANLKGEVATGTIASVISGTRGTVARPTSSFWVCISSSNGTGTANGTDLWTATFDGTKIVHALGGTNHSWMYLKSPEALGPVYVVLDCCAPVTVGDDHSNAGIIWSYFPFTGGTATTRPRSVVTPLIFGSPVGSAEWASGLSVIS